MPTSRARSIRSPKNTPCHTPRQAPVLREIYSEKQVVLEERRLRVDNSPLGPFQEQLALRSLGNNYRRPVIGFEADIQRIGRREVAQFFGERYGPQSLTIAVAGDVKPEQIRRLAERYWGGWEQPAGSVPPSACDADGHGERAARPPEDAPLQYQAESRAGPAVSIAFYRPCVRSPDSLTLDVASDLLTGSRSSRLYRGLVTPGKALTVTSFASFPAEKHANQVGVCLGGPVCVGGKGGGRGGGRSLAAAAAAGGGRRRARARISLTSLLALLRAVYALWHSHAPELHACPGG